MDKTAGLDSYAFTNVDAMKDPSSLVTYLDKANYDPVVRRAKSKILSQFLRPTKGEHILDVGCGVGHDVHTIAKRVGPNGHVTGLDISRTMIHEARRRSSHPVSRVSFHTGDIHRLEFPDKSFNGCLVASTFLHLCRPKRAIKEIVRVLKPCGRLVAVEPDWDTLVMTTGSHALSAILIKSIRHGVRNSGIAHHLPVLFYRAGLNSMKVGAGTTMAFTYNLANCIWRIEENLQRALQCGAVTHMQMTGLLRHLRLASKRGHFFASSTTFVVRGKKS